MLLALLLMLSAAHLRTQPTSRSWCHLWQIDGQSSRMMMRTWFPCSRYVLKILMVKSLSSVFQCLASVSIAMGPAFFLYAGPVFERCNNIIHQSLLQYQAFQQNPELDEPGGSFLVVALDLLSGLTQGLGMSLEPFITNSSPNMLNLLTFCLKHPQAPVRQSAYALVGDMAMGCFTLLRPHMPGIMQELIQQLDPEPKLEFISASNNAAWSVGEVALRYGRGKLILGFNLSCLTLSRRWTRVSAMGGGAYQASHSHSLTSQSTQKLTWECSSFNRSHWIYASHSCCSSSAWICSSLVSGPLRDSWQRWEGLRVPWLMHTCANKSCWDHQGKNIHSDVLDLPLIRHCIPRVYYGSATRLFDGVSHRQNSTTCSVRSFKDSNNMMKRDGQRRWRHSLQSYENVWPSGIMSK